MSDEEEPGRARRRTRPDRAPEPLTPERLEALALAYVDRFDTTAANLRRVLQRHVRRAALRGAEPDTDRLARTIDALILRWQGSGVIDDGRLAASLALGLRARGGSTRAIRQKLAQKGIATPLVDAALEDSGRDEADPELSAARAFARRRRLGAHRTPLDSSPERRRKDLAALARAGFAFDVARRALGALAPDDLDEE